MITINRYLEHTNLTPTVTDLDIDQLVKEAKEYQLLGVCVPPFWVKRAAREIGYADIALVTVVGFPLGYQMTESKMEETKLGLKDGATEIDVVMNISAFKSKLPWVKIELAKLATLIHNEGAMMKVILETAYLTDEEIVQAAMIAKDAGTDFVKTSTGFANGGATVEHIKLLRGSMPSSIGIKASGSIKTLDQAVSLINAGADRIGTSSGVSIAIASKQTT
jgi:deoxyribose-phosphate aldolase